MSLAVDPVWAPYQESLKKHVQGVAREGTQVDVHGVKFVDPMLERSHYVRYLNEAQVIENAITAEMEGYIRHSLCNSTFELENDELIIKRRFEHDEQDYRN